MSKVVPRSVSCPTFQLVCEACQFSPVLTACLREGLKASFTSARLMPRSPPGILRLSPVLAASAPCPLFSVSRPTAQVPPALLSQSAARLGLSPDLSPLLSSPVASLGPKRSSPGTLSVQSAPDPGLGNPVTTLGGSSALAKMPVLPAAISGAGTPPPSPSQRAQLTGQSLLGLEDPCSLCWVFCSSSQC